MLTPAAARAISPDERIKMIGPIVSQKVQDALDREILIAVARKKNTVNTILSWNSNDSSDTIISYLEVLGYENVKVVHKYHEDGSSTTVQFSIPA